MNCDAAGRRCDLGCKEKASRIGEGGEIHLKYERARDDSIQVVHWECQGGSVTKLVSPLIADYCVGVEVAPGSDFHTKLKSDKKTMGTGVHLIGCDDDENVDYSECELGCDTQQRAGRSTDVLVHATHWATVENGQVKFGDISNLCPRGFNCNTRDSPEMWSKEKKKWCDEEKKKKTPSPREEEDDEEDEDEDEDDEEEESRAEEEESQARVGECCGSNDDCEDDLVCEEESATKEEKVCKLPLGSCCEGNKEDMCASGLQCKQGTCKKVAPCKRLRIQHRRRREL